MAAVGGCALTVVTFFPGYMSWDSVTYLRQGRSGVYLDEQSPVVSFVWGLLDLVITGPALMLVFQNALLWLGLYLFFRFALPGPRWRPLAIASVGLWPGVFSMSGTIWKDVHMTAAYLLAAALLQESAVTGSRRPLAFVLPLLVYGTAARLNAAAALLPLCLWAAFVAWKSFGQPPSRLKPILAGAALSVLVVGLSTGWQRLLTGGKTVFPAQYLLEYDLAAMSVEVGENLLPDYFQEEPNPVTLEVLRHGFYPYSGVTLIGSSPTREKLAHDAERYAAVRRTWVRAVVDHPRAWLKHRRMLVSNMFGMGRDPVVYVMHDGIEPENGLGLVFRPSAWNRLVSAGLWGLRETVVFKGWAYMLLIIASVALALRRNRASLPLVIPLATSAGLYAAAYVVVAPSSEYRYLLWSVVVSLLLPWVALGKPRETT